MTGIVDLILRIILAVLLYSFLGWALYTLWKDLRLQSQRISAPSIPTLSLAPLDGNEQPESLFSVPEVILGRSANCDFPVIDETVSARHARLSFHQNQWWVEDLHSTNGTFLNDERVSVPTVVIAGDELRCGQVPLLIGIDDKAQ